MKVSIEVNYTACSYTTVELPEGKTWDDVEEWYVKWGTLRIMFKGDTDYREYETSEVNCSDSIDWKYPSVAKAWGVHADDEDQPDFDNELGEYNP